VDCAASPPGVALGVDLVEPAAGAEREPDEGKGLPTKSQAYDLTSVINDIRSQVDTWRNLPASQWQATPETARLLQHWRAPAGKPTNP
jgi:hypothetical protein